MALSSTSARRLLAAGIAAIAALGGAAAPASAVQSTTLTYKCKYPLLGTQPVSVKLNLDVPDLWRAEEPTPAFAITAALTAAGNTVPGLGLIDGLAAIEGTATTSSTVAVAGGLPPIVVKVPLSIPKYTLPTPTPDPLVLSAAGTAPSLVIDDVGPATIKLDKLALNLKFTDAQGEPIIIRRPDYELDWDGAQLVDSDGNPETFDVPCKLDAGQDATLASIELYSSPPKPPSCDQPPVEGATGPGDFTPTSINLRWNYDAASAANCGGLKGFVVEYDGHAVEVPADARSYRQTVLQGQKDYFITLTALTNSGARSKPLELFWGFGDPTPAIPHVFDVAGAAQLRTLVKGTVPLKGEARIRFGGTGLVVGDSLTFAPTQARLIGLGFLPVTAKLAFVSSGVVSGTTGGIVPGLTLNQKVRIKVLEAKLFGAIPLAGGNNCQTKSLTALSLNGPFSEADGGKLTGTFAISDLNGCGALNGLVSPVVAGGGNTIALTLTPKK